jgi:predicted nicotinamide N-methyase
VAEKNPDGAAPTTSTSIAGFPARATRVRFGGTALDLYGVADLEALVDRDALLRGDAEPPYWAYLWSGARAVADYLTRWTSVRGRRVLEIGCGLGLPGAVAAAAGADVTFVDGARPALAFVRATLRANGLRGACVCADYRLLSPRARFALVLAAEVAYEPERFDDLAATLARHLAPDGLALVADGFRTDTRPLYRALAAHGLVTRALELRMTEEGRPARVRLTEAWRPATFSSQHLLGISR